MRKRFEQQPELGTVPIAEVGIPLRTRHELPPVLAGLQHIFRTPELNAAVFAILEGAVCSGKKKTGRKGMDFWEIFVLGVVRLCVDANYDQLHHMANFDDLLRGILGVSKTDFSQGKVYGLSTIKENVRLLDEATIEKINLVVVKEGHRIVKKKEYQPLNIKADSYVLESNVHFPTDLNLLLDSVRKCIDILGDCHVKYGLSGWRKHKNWAERLRNHYRRSSKVTWGGGQNKEERVKSTVGDYLQVSRELSTKVEKAMQALSTVDLGIDMPGLIAILYQLEYYHEMLDKHIDLVDRRLLQGEIIPHSEKLFSIFEDHVEWIKKGKSNNRVEIGHRVLIATDQFNFILKHKVMVRQEDVEMTVPLAEELQRDFEWIESISYDRAFYSKPNKEALLKLIPIVNLPKKGKCNPEEGQEESTKVFKKLRKSHSGVESNINQLESNGLNTCPDKSLKGFRCYTALGVVSYNLHHLGTYLQKAQRIEEARKKKRLRAAA